MKPKVLIITLIILIPLVVAAVAYAAVSAGWITINKDAKEYTYELGEYTVNLNSQGYNRYIKVNIQASYNDKVTKKQLEKNSYKISDMINNVLRSKTLDDVNTPEKTDQVKGEIKDKINEIIGKGKLTSIYFSQIIVQ